MTIYKGKLVNRADIINEDTEWITNCDGDRVPKLEDGYMLVDPYVLSKEERKEALDTVEYGKDDKADVLKALAKIKCSRSAG